MPSMCHYPGNVVDALVAQGEAGHLFGPDRCGDYRINMEMVQTAARVGPRSMADMYAQQGASARGAFYELERVEYDEATDRTTAWFKPKLDPLQSVRYYGGNPNERTQPVLSGSSRMAGRDDIKAR